MLLTDTGDKEHSGMRSKRRKKIKSKRRDEEQESLQDLLRGSHDTSNTNSKDLKELDESQQNIKITLSFKENGKIDPKNLTPTTISLI